MVLKVIVINFNSYGYSFLTNTGPSQGLGDLISMTRLPLKINMHYLCMDPLFTLFTKLFKTVLNYHMNFTETMPDHIRPHEVY